MSDNHVAVLLVSDGREHPRVQAFEDEVAAKDAVHDEIREYLEWEEEPDGTLVAQYGGVTYSIHLTAVEGG